MIDIAPHFVESEAAVIGASIWDRRECGEAFDRLTADHFFEPAHAALWNMIRNSGQSDPVILAGKLSDNGPLNQLGGIGYLANLVEKASSAALPAHIDAIIDAATRREIDKLGRWARDEASKAGQGEAALSEIERACVDIARHASNAPAAAPVGLTALDNLDGALEGKFRGVEVGVQAIDRVTGGIKSDDVWIIGGRSSMGKSIVGLCLARGIAEQGLGVMMFSLEMPTREVQARLISDIAFQSYAGVRNVRYSDILRGRLEPDQIDSARKAAKQLASLPMTVSDLGGLTIDDIRHQALRQVRAWEKAGIKPGAVLIDHLGLVKPVKNTGNKAADTSETVNELKDIAKRLRCPLIALAQVNRGPEARNDKRPTMGDLNWSGSIEQIADFVCLLYRQSYYDARSSEQDDLTRAEFNKHDIELLIQKNRSGPICTVKAWIDVASNALRDALEDQRRAA